jgi:nucleoside-diphosphate-sugar epimerase
MGAQPRFLITGASGFVGQHLTQALVQRHGRECVTAMVPLSARPDEAGVISKLRALGIAVVPCDLLRAPSHAAKIPDFDVLYHLAAYAHTEDPAGPFEVNSEGTRRLFEWLGARLSKKWVIYTGTIASVDRPYAAGPARDDSPCLPITPYGRTKLEGENLVRQQSVIWGSTYTILRLCTIVGHGYRLGGMFEVFPEMLRRGSWATRLNWPGRLTLVSVSDLARILIEVPCRSAMANVLLTLGNGEALTFDSLLTEMAALLRLERRRIEVPVFLWRLLRGLAWRTATLPGLPYRARIFGWRVSYLLGDGLWADNSGFQARLPFPFQSSRDALREIYGQN